jgi:tripartite-type tricarboxylate transporter receptor subunit TctC
MTQGRRWFVAAAIAAGLSAAAAMPLLAETYPSKTVRFVVPYPPGGASDVTARMMAEKLTELYGHPFVVENRPGANGNIALEHVARSAADGYTILMGNVGPNAINAGLYPKLPFDPIKDFAPITLTTTVPLVLLVSQSSPFKTTADLVGYAKANPGAVKFASGGLGSATHLTAELLKKTAAIDIVHVPYKGDAPAMTDLIGGHVDMTFATAIAAAPNIAASRVRVLATASQERPKSLAQYPTVAESGIVGFESTSWGGVMAPGGTPAPIVASLHNKIVQVLAMPDIREKLVSMGVEVVGGTPEEFASYLKAEIDKWTSVIQAAAVKIE